MDDQILNHETHINDITYGPIHTGSGNINIYYQRHVIALSEKEQGDLLLEYAVWQRERYLHMPISGIPLPINVNVPLHDVYIKLRILPQQRQLQDTFPMKHKATLEEALAIVKRFGELQWQQAQDTDARSTLAGRPSEEPVSPEYAISQHDKIAIIGVPGSGKSTLLRHLVWEHANDSPFSIPLLIPLGQVDILMDQSHILLLEAALEILTEHKVGEAKLQLKSALISAIGRKHVHFLFDGLDEVHVCKKQIIDTLNDLVADGYRIVITSRPIGYERLEGIEHYEVLPLLPADAASFSLRWFNMLAEARRVPINERQAWAIERGEWLKAQINDRPSLREIARVPLLLTFLAILAGDEPRKDLPRLRKKLYKEYVERLFTTWESQRKKLTLGNLEGEKARTLALWVLYRTAYILHSVYYSNSLEEQPTPEFVKKILTGEIARRWSFNELESTALSSEILDFWEHAGLLIRYRIQKEEIFAFRHLTFQEYGSARALADLAESEPDTLSSLLQEHMFTPQWGEVLPLTIAHLEFHECTYYVKQLIDADQIDVKWHRPLLLAANALAEGANPSDFFHRTIIDKLIKLAQVVPMWTLDGINATTLFNILAKQEDDDYCADLLLTIVHHEDSDLFQRVLATEALARIGRRSDAIDIFHSLSKAHPRDFPLQLWIARILSRLELKDDVAEILQPTMALLSEAVTGGAMAGVIAEILAELGKIDQATEILTKLVTNHLEKERVRIEAIKGLIRIQQLGTATFLAHKLANEKSLNDFSRSKLIEILNQLGPPKELQKLLVEMLRNEKSFRSQSIEAFKIFSCTKRTFEYIQVLVSIIYDKDLESKLQIHAVKELTQFNQDTIVKDILLSLANNPEIDRKVSEVARVELNGLNRNSFLISSSTDKSIFDKDAFEDSDKRESSENLITRMQELRYRLYWIVGTQILIAVSAFLLFQVIIIPALSFLYERTRDSYFMAIPLSARIPLVVGIAFYLISPILIYHTYKFIESGLLEREK